MAEEAKGLIRSLNKKIGKSFDRYGVEVMRKVLIAYTAALAMACSAQQTFAAVFVSGLQTSPVAPFIPDPSTFLAEITFTLNLGVSLDPPGNLFNGEVVLNSSASFLGGSVSVSETNLTTNQFVGQIASFNIGSGGSQRSFSWTVFLPPAPPSGLTPAFYTFGIDIGSLSYLNHFTVADCLDFLCTTTDTPFPVDLSKTQSSIFIVAGIEVMGVTQDTPVPSETPLPAALPLFAGGLGALGLLGWRRKKKAAAPAA